METELYGQPIAKHDFSHGISLVTDAGFKLNIEHDCTLHTSARPWNISPRLNLGVLFHLPSN